MTSAFANMKSKRSKRLNDLTEELEKIQSPQSSKIKDERFWKLTRDDAGNGSAQIRFLPASPKVVDGQETEEDLPWVQFFTHSFKGPGGQWYIERSLTSIGQNDPVSEYNSQLWATGEEAKKDIARKQKRRLRYVSNILVVKDPAKPENNGKVFLFEYGKKIFDKINDAMNPEDDGLEEVNPINPFDFWEGADFKLKVRQLDGYPNYDKSEFCESSPISEDDSELESIWRSQYSLEDLVAPDKFKSYDELKRRLDRVLGLSNTQKFNGSNSNATKTASPAPAETTSESAGSAEAATSSFQDIDEDEEAELQSLLEGI